MPIPNKILKACVLLAIILLGAWNIGFLSTDGEHEDHSSLFIKEKQTLKLSFRNSYYSVVTGNDAQVEKWLDPQDRWIHGSEQFDDFSSYCWHRFGMVDITSPEATQECLDRGGYR